MDDKIKKNFENEVDELKALESYHKLHSAREELFENITWLAAIMCNVPISIINLSERDFRGNKSYQNTGPKIDLDETNFCEHSLVSDGIFEIPDASKDPRFKDNPIVTAEPRILFYADVPIINPAGEKEGILCVIDKKANKLDLKQQQALKKLANMVAILLETRKNILMDIQQIKNAEQSIAEANKKLQFSLLSQQKYNSNMTLLEEMSGVLQACQSYKEAYQVIAQYCQKIFPKVRGYLYFMNVNHQFVELVTYFGFKEIDNKDKAFLVDDCWGLRLGSPHQSCFKEEVNNSLHCQHVHNKSKSIQAYSCLPLSSQGDIFGLLYLEFPQCEEKSEDESGLIFKKTFAEQISLSISNLKLRTTLQKQSITDPLTGLFNRRYYNENINWIIYRSKLRNECLAFVMIDIDFFKKFNDNYGHDVGDAVLIKITELIRKFAKEGDIACRMGGEEFLFLIYDEAEDNIKQTLESLRKAAETAEIVYKDKTVQPPCISIGAAFLDKKEITVDPETLLIEADKALYVSKETGRNRISYAS